MLKLPFLEIFQLRVDKFLHICFSSAKVTPCNTEVKFKRGGSLKLYQMIYCVFDLKHHKILIPLEDDAKTYIVVAHCVHIIFQMTLPIIW